MSTPSKYVELYRDFINKEMADLRAKGLSWFQVGAIYGIEKSNASKRVKGFLEKYKDIYVRKDK